MFRRTLTIVPLVRLSRPSLLGPIVLVVALTIVFGFTRGFGACGAPGWWRPTHVGLLLIACAAGVWVTHRWRWWQRGASVLLLLLIHEIAIATGSAFYPQPPESLSEFILNWTFALIEGPC